MIYLLLSIILHVAIFLIFRFYAIYKIDRLGAIIVNYIVCVLTGLIFLRDFAKISSVGFETPWIPWAIATGALFVFTFNLMAYCTQVFSVTVSSVSSKIALVIPVVFSLFILKIGVEGFTLFNYIGILLALSAVVLTSYQENKENIHVSGLIKWLVPLGVFVFSGFIDVILNYANYAMIPSEEEKVYPIFAFLSAAIFGLVALLIRRKKVGIRSVIAGIILGIPNYFSIYFLLKALSSFENNGAVLYPFLNIGIILTSALFSVILFKERLSGINKLGLLFAVIAIILISFGGFL
ncbi:MAG: hypothetical protein AAF363_04690 [Bacteroidota bacterium]